MALLAGVYAQQANAASNKPHILSFSTARTAAADTLLEVWNGTANTARKFVVDLDGKPYSAAWTAGDVPYVVAGSVTSVKRMDTLAIGAANTVLTSSGTAPQWSTALTLAGSLGVGTTAIVGSTTAATGSPALDVVGALTIVGTNTVADATEKNSRLSVRHYTNAEESVALVMGVSSATVNTVNIGGGTVLCNAATTIQFFTAANQTTTTGTSRGSITSTGLLNWVGPGTFGGLVTASAGLTVASGQTLTLTGATVAGTPTWSSAQAITLSTAAQTNVTSLGTLTALQVDNLNLNGNTLSSTAGTDLLITPLAGQQIVLDGAIVIDAGVVTGATSITSTAFVGDLTGNVTGNASGTAATVTGAAQTAITSVGTLTSLGVGAITSTGLIKTTLTSQQLALHYDASNHLAVTVGATGGVTYNATGSGAGHSFSDLVTAAAGLTVSSGQTLTLTSATVTGLGAASVTAGTFPSGAFVFQGAVSGITTLSCSGNLTVNSKTTIAASTGYITVPENGPAAPQFGDASQNGFYTTITLGNLAGISVGGIEALQADADATAGNTRIQVYDVNAASLQRVRVGANNTGPGGSGRAMYLDNV